MLPNKCAFFYFDVTFNTKSSLCAYFAPILLFRVANTAPGHQLLYFWYVYHPYITPPISRLTSQQVVSARYATYIPQVQFQLQWNVKRRLPSENYWWLAVCEDFDIGFSVCNLILLIWKLCSNAPSKPQVDFFPETF